MSPTVRVLSGALAGGLATVPMTIVMNLLHARLPRHEQYPLPPREITEAMTEKAGVREHLDEDERHLTALAAHYAFGVSAGAVYSVAPASPQVPSALRGLTFGLAVWGVSYLGLLPGLGLLRPATEHPPCRTALMIGAHILWGATLGVLLPALSSQGRSV